MSNQQTGITKSFVLRLDFDAETELDKIVLQLGMNQTKTVRHIIMNFRSQERQLAAYKMELAKVQRELASVKENLNIVFQGFGNLQKFIE
jgi:polyphosphate kinase 2 (PPK2 family)